MRPYFERSTRTVDAGSFTRCSAPRGAEPPHAATSAGASASKTVRRRGDALRRPAATSEEPAGDGVQVAQQRRGGRRAVRRRERGGVQLRTGRRLPAGLRLLRFQRPAERRGRLLDRQVTMLFVVALENVVVAA